MIDDIIELDNFLPVDYVDRLEKRLMHPSFPWALTLDSVYGADGKIENVGAVGFYHNIVFNNNQRSEDLSKVEPVLMGLEKALGGKLVIDVVERIRVGLFTCNADPSPHAAHVDAYFPHWTAVYYVNDCDGDLTIYEETWPTLLPDQAKFSQLTVKKKVKPAKGKIVLFPGQHYHASSYPTVSPLRIAITFNFTSK